MSRILTLTLVAIATVPLQAQRTNLTGTVLDSTTGDPLAGVTVALLNLELQTATDSRGRFRFYGIASGTHTVTVRHVSFEPWAMRFRLDASRHREVGLGTVRLTALAGTQLDPLQIRGQLISEYPQLEGFLRRMRVEQGTFFTEADIQRERPRNTSDLLRKVPGFTTNEAGRVVSSRGVANLQSPFEGCRVEYFINGVHVTNASIDVILPSTIVGMEIYSGSSTIPTIYRAGLSNPRCGVIAVWTRHTRR